MESPRRAEDLSPFGVVSLPSGTGGASVYSGGGGPAAVNALSIMPFIAGDDGLDACMKACDERVTEVTKVVLSNVMGNDAALREGRTTSEQHAKEEEKYKSYYEVVMKSIEKVRDWNKAMHASKEPKKEGGK